jgi:NhaA family Na+:H+ antiporter
MAGGKSERREQAATHLPHLLSQQSTSSHRLINELDSARNSALSPLELLQHRLEPWVLYFIMPVFALANAGVDFGAVTFTDSSSTWVVAGIALGLFLGKPLGIVLASWLAIRLTGARLPAGVTWPVLWGLGLLAGVGFTVALFITSLAFTDQSIATVARIGVLGGSVFSAVTGLALLGWTLPKRVKSASQAPKERPG